MKSLSEFYITAIGVLGLGVAACIFCIFVIAVIMLILDLLNGDYL